MQINVRPGKLIELLARLKREGCHTYSLTVHRDGSYTLAVGEPRLETPLLPLTTPPPALAAAR